MYFCFARCTAFVQYNLCVLDELFIFFVYFACLHTLVVYEGWSVNIFMLRVIFIADILYDILCTMVQLFLLYIANFMHVFFDIYCIIV